MARPIDANTAGAKLDTLYHGLTEESARSAIRQAMELIRLEPTLEPDPEPVSQEALQALREGTWVWIQVLVKFDCRTQVSAYYRKAPDFTRGRSFCCGYPGIAYTFDYQDYGRTWTAFTCRPPE